MKDRIPIAYQKIRWIEIEKGVYTVEVSDTRKVVKIPEEEKV